MIILIKYEAPKKIEQGRGKMKKIISNLSVVIFVIGCAIMEITTWFIVNCPLCQGHFELV